MRLVNKRFARATSATFVRSLAWDRTIYPRYSSVARFIACLVRFPGMSETVKDLTLVGEAMKPGEYGYAWAWEDLQNWENVDFTDADVAIINEINAAHAHDCASSSTFINSGGYRTMLGLAFAHCPNLQTITIRKLQASSLLCKATPRSR